MLTSFELIGNPPGVFTADRSQITASDASGSIGLVYVILGRCYRFA
jgi:hypothetical protein